MIEFSLLPLYDPVLPLEYFMTSAEAMSFRTILKNVTDGTFVANAECQETCKAVSVNGKVTQSGYCRPNIDPVTRTLNYTCEQFKTLFSTLPPTPAPTPAPTLAPTPAPVVYSWWIYVWLIDQNNDLAKIYEDGVLLLPFRARTTEP